MERRFVLTIADLRTAVYKTFPWQPPSDTNPTTNFFVPLVWKDTVLFHATLHFSALRLESGRAGRLGVDVRGLEGECIRLLRERVEGEGREQAVSDLTISAVATMASVEVCFLSFFSSVCFEGKVKWRGDGMLMEIGNSMRKATCGC